MSEEVWAMGRDTVDHNRVIGYMCKIDWSCELGSNYYGNTVYPSIESLKADHEMWEECGIVEVEVTFRDTIVEGTV